MSARAYVRTPVGRTDSPAKKESPATPSRARQRGPARRPFPPVATLPPCALDLDRAAEAAPEPGSPDMNAPESYWGVGLESRAHLDAARCTHRILAAPLQHAFHDLVNNSGALARSSGSELVLPIPRVADG